MKGFERENAIKIKKKVKDNKRGKTKRSFPFNLSMLSNIKSYIDLTFLKKNTRIKLKKFNFFL